MRKLYPWETNWLLAHDWRLDQIENLTASDEETPVEYLTGRASFDTLELSVSPAVLIPRPETAKLVDIILTDVADKQLLDDGRYRFVDVGTGSGAIAIRLAQKLQTRVLALDVSPEALEVADRNIKEQGVERLVERRESDLLENLDTVQLSPEWILVANLPYIPSKIVKSLTKSVQNYEPLAALDGGEDGFELIRRLLDHVKKLERKPVSIYLEVDQSHTLDFLPSLPAWRWHAAQDQFGRHRYLIGHQNNKFPKIASKNGKFGVTIEESRN